mmetsp:Transcript_19303/g.19638  ORF Transcript_19303/g.19638 Transcript_19303/m.19638 type:complete len:261 (-) Transcript_19303:76-858(-)
MNSSTNTNSNTQTIVNYINNNNDSDNNNNNEANRINKHRVTINTVSATSTAIPVEMLNSSTNTASTFQTGNTKTNFVKQEAAITASTSTTMNHKKKGDYHNINNNNNKPIVHRGVSTVNKHPHSHYRNTSAKQQQQQHYLGPDHDEIVRRLIGDQQALLRTMIQNETERVLSSEVFFCHSSGSGSGPPLLVSTLSRTAAIVGTTNQNIPQTTATVVTPSTTPLSTTTTTTTTNTTATTATPATSSTTTTTTTTANSVTAV